MQILWKVAVWIYVGKSCARPMSAKKISCFWEILRLDSKLLPYIDCSHWLLYWSFFFIKPGTTKKQLSQKQHRNKNDICVQCLLLFWSISCAGSGYLLSLGCFCDPCDNHDDGSCNLYYLLLLCDPRICNICNKQT